MHEIDIIERVIRNIAHEVRNPLTTVKGYAQLLSQKNDPALIVKSKNMIIEQSERIDTIFTQLYDAFTVMDDDIIECAFPEVLYMVVEESSYRDYITIERNTQFSISLYANRFQQCLSSIINGFNWKYFSGASLYLNASKEIRCNVSISFSGIVFDSIPEDFFYYPFQCRQFFSKGSELFKVYCIAQRSGWQFTFFKERNGFALEIPI